jgi:hypothetical protein
VLGALDADPGLAANVGEDIALSHLDEGQLGVVAVRGVVWKDQLTSAREL